MMGLTHRQADLLAYLERREEPWAPSFTEMRVALGLESNSSVARLLDGLEDRGCIRRLYGHARSVEVLRPGPVVIRGEVYLYIPKTRAA